jgi:superfamily II DNA helicase RecQ
MFHAGTPNSTKSLILENILQHDGHIRILICTVAFGMGVNCKGVYRVIHFGPSLNIESYVQECGRAGCDGKDSICILLHNGFLSSNCSSDMCEYIAGDKCRRQLLLKQFPSSSKLNKSGCKCCDICASGCKCSGIVGDCALKFPLTIDEECSQHTFTKSRVVTGQQKELLKSKLLEYVNKIRQNCKKPVLFPNVHFEFSVFTFLRCWKTAHIYFQ